MKYIIFFIPFILSGCLKHAFYFQAPDSNNNNLILEGMWLSEGESGQNIRIILAQNGPEPIFIDWSKADLKIGDDASVTFGVTPNYTVAMVDSSAQSVFELQPMLDFVSSSNPLYVGQYIIAPENLKGTSKKIMIALDTCTGGLKEGFRPMECAENGDGWKRTILRGELFFGKMSYGQ